MNSLLRKSGYVAAIIAVLVIGLMTFRGPQGLAELMEKREQIRKMQEANATLMKENDDKRRRIDGLRKNPEVEMRNRLKLQKQGETSYIVPEQESK